MRYRRLKGNRDAVVLHIFYLFEIFQQINILYVKRDVL